MVLFTTAYSVFSALTLSQDDRKFSSKRKFLIPLNVGKKHCKHVNINFDPNGRKSQFDVVVKVLALKSGD